MNLRTDRELAEHIEAHPAKATIGTARERDPDLCQVQHSGEQRGGHAEKLAV